METRVDTGALSKKSDMHHAVRLKFGVLPLRGVCARNCLPLLARDGGHIYTPLIVRHVTNAGRTAALSCVVLPEEFV